MDLKLIGKVILEEERGEKEWGAIDKTPGILLNALTEEVGEVAHAINNDEGQAKIQQEIAEAIGVLSRLYDMVREEAVAIPDKWPRCPCCNGLRADPPLEGCISPKYGHYH